MLRSATAKHGNTEVTILAAIQRKSFGYFLHETNLANGLVIDKTCGNWPASIAAVGLALAAYPVGVERTFLDRDEAVRRTLTTLRFFAQSPQGPEPNATGYKGFYYHFLDMKTGQRAWQCELSTVDTALLLAGTLAAGAYFDRNTPAAREIRPLANELYARADWQWAQNGGATVTHGWKPESGFLPWRWEGYDEALILYLLGLGIDYFENSRRAAYVQQQYAMRNPRGFQQYGEHCWGITARASSWIRVRYSWPLKLSA